MAAGRQRLMVRLRRAMWLDDGREQPQQQRTVHKLKGKQQQPPRRSGASASFANSPLSAPGSAVLNACAMIVGHAAGLSMKVHSSRRCHHRATVCTLLHSLTSPPTCRFLARYVAPAASLRWRGAQCLPPAHSPSVHDLPSDPRHHSQNPAVPAPPPAQHLHTSAAHPPRPAHSPPASEAA